MKPIRRKAAIDIPPGLDPEGAHPVKQERSRQLRDKALLHVRDLVREGRFTSTTMADIARAVGCSAGALYFRFRDKEALFASVVEVAMAQEAEAIAADAAARADSSGSNRPRKSDRNTARPWATMPSTTGAP